MLEFEASVLPLLVPPPELRALELAVAAPPLLTRGVVSIHKLRQRVRPLGWVGMSLGLLAIVFKLDGQRVVQQLAYMLAALGIAALLAGITAVALRNPAIRAWLQRTRMRMDSRRPMSNASLEPPTTDNDHRDAAQASLFATAYRVITFLSVGSVLANIIVACMLYLTLLFVVVTRLNGAPFIGFVLAPLVVPVFLAAAYMMLWHSCIRWLAILITLLASLGFIWPVLEVPATILLLLVFIMWGWSEIRSVFKNASRNVWKLRSSLRRIGYGLGVLGHPWGYALRRVSSSDTVHTAEAHSSERSGDAAEKLVAYDLWEQHLQTAAQAKRADLFHVIAAQREQMAMLGGPKVLSDACAAIELVGVLWP
jgi:hypothetical protein